MKIPTWIASGPYSDWADCADLAHLFPCEPAAIGDGVAFHKSYQCDKSTKASGAEAEEVGDELTYGTTLHTVGVQLCVSCCGERHQSENASYTTMPCSSIA
jgi:hypothetical protein